MVKSLMRKAEKGAMATPTNKNAVSKKEKVEEQAAVTESSASS